MKKLICILLSVSLLLAFAACDKENAADKSAEKVTIYIPETITSYSPDGTESITLNMVFEDGWETKEIFTVTYSGNTQMIGDKVPVMTFNGKTFITEIPGVSRVETTCDDHGRVLSQTTWYLAENAAMEKQVITYTYDTYGRKLTDEVKYYYPGTSEPVKESRTYTYEKTETGSRGTASVGEITYVIDYDKDYHIVAQITIMRDQEISHSEIEYDANGNQSIVTAYSQGQKMLETKYTYKAVEVSAETAARLPQFKRAN